MAEQKSGDMLPFGRTDASPDELRSYVEAETAINILACETDSAVGCRVSEFVGQLQEVLSWLEENGRHYPWRTTQDPWRIYISEILLQRTRADAVASIYDEFFEQFPGPATLRQSSEEEIKTTIDGLGFGNQRTQTLQDVASILGENHDDTVPDSVEELQRPWRVGPYSARATMVFAFDEPMALVDSNFARVIERIFGYDMPAQPHKSETIYELLDSLVPADPALCRATNLALLDLAAAVCTPGEPDCSVCPLAPCCTYSGQ